MFLVKERIVIHCVFLAAFLMAMLLNGCATMSSYDAYIRNVGSEHIDHAGVIFGDHRIGGGVVAPGSHKRTGDIRHPIPEKATVMWQDINGKKYTTEVEVKKLLPPRKPEETYEIFFDIYEDNTVAVKITSRRIPSYSRDYVTQ
ncbi:hypothetical protein ACFL0R_04895 [Pseudomonadota bacterium]